MTPKEYTLACLYGSAPPTFDFDDLVDAIFLDERLPNDGFQVLVRQEGRMLSIDFGRHFIIQVEIHYDPMPAENLAIALQGSKATVLQNNFGPLIAAHKSYIGISSRVETAQGENTMARRLRLYAMQMIAEYLFHIDKPVLLYSDLAQSLTLPSTSPRSYFGRLDSGIFEQAVLSARGGAVGSGAPIGAHAWGGEDLIGKPVVFRPTAMPPWAVTQGVTRFFEYCDVHGIPPNGSTFTDEKDRETYQVDHFARSANYARGRVEVSIIRNLDAHDDIANGTVTSPDLLGNGHTMRTPERSKSHNAPKRQYNAIFVTVFVTAATMAMMYFLQG